MTQLSTPSRTRSRLLQSGLIFWVILLSVCFWVLSLPLFPSQDGPVHRYYVKTVAFDPHKGAGLLPLAAANGVLLDSPWFDQNISPLALVANHHLHISDIFGDRHPTHITPDAEHSLPRDREKEMAESSAYGFQPAFRSGLDLRMQPAGHLLPVLQAR